jgi:hypothetical protein
LVNKKLAILKNIDLLRGLSDVSRLIKIRKVLPKLSSTFYYQKVFVDPKGNVEMHQPGIEPGASAWQAEILPLNH